MTDPTIRVAVCDDHSLFRTGLRMILSNQPDMTFVGEAVDGPGGIALARDLRPDVLLMDVRMPGIDGIEATERIIAELGDAAPRILILTTFDLDEAVARAVAAGASGFVLKAAEPDLLTAAIRTIHAGNQLFAANATVELLQRFASQPAQPAAKPVPAAYETLSDRERDVFLLVAEGLSNAEIAAREFVSAGTVKTHISHILAKLQLRDRVQLVVYAYAHGLVGH
ncbi:response regulator transcription factor [Pseudoclavibacter chungangensis]|uniref:Response regulator transcription factor n=1 Tax=Pseudoclavibacter chungangensis TaxID=587635 RepID=A0A7J5BTG8_9MICO|nr:response regulator transcription factor [Pseudoclavibacter chungangensis]KAB1656837.1 response regulator transcription factor [Pseudoclavibacter chungangensis]NYJ67297.1 DNA-binding NarL/FixJ family response regulator [Pseudoclavibacter chungangensis]